MKTPHPIPYQGSKRFLAPAILAYFPQDTHRLLEPFAGAAAVSLAAALAGRARHFELNDINAPLMELWMRIVESPESIAAAYRKLSSLIRPLPGARQLLDFLTAAKIPWAIATSGRMETAAVNLQALEVDPNTAVVVTRDQVRFAKPDPDLFVEAARRLGAPIESCLVVGDSIWDMLAAARCRALGVGLLSGGYGQDELERSGALRVYEDPADLLRHVDEVASRAR